MHDVILVIDDSQMVRQQLGRALTAAGFAVVDAVDGVDALEKLDAGPAPSLVLCDVNMPRMSGLDMLEAMRTRPRLATVPVLMLTTESHPLLIDRAKKLGARGWVMKPFKTDLVLATVRKLVAPAAAAAPPPPGT